MKIEQMKPPTLAKDASINTQIQGSPSETEPIRLVDTSNPSQQSAATVPTVQPWNCAKATTGLSQLRADVEPIESEWGLEGLPWQVLCSRAAKDQIFKLEPSMRRLVLSKIVNIASGYWPRKQKKSLEGVPKSMHLYEAYITKSARMLWEIGVDFSGLTNTYSEMIRYLSLIACRLL